MTKREMIDEILSINLSAEPQFLARFADGQLFEYLTHLRVLSTPRLIGNAERYEKYFRNLPAVAGPRPRWRCDTEHAQEIAIDDQAGPANDAQPVAAAVEHAQVPAAPTDALAVGPDDWAPNAATTSLLAPAGEPAPQPHADEEAPQDALADQGEDASRQELVAQDVDLAVGQAEREQLLSTPAELADAPAEDDEADDANMEAPYKIAAAPRRTASARAVASTAARHMLYGADTPQPPPRPRRRAKSCVPAAVTAAPQADQDGQNDLDDEKWPY